jgi:hypothetical protein
MDFDHGWAYAGTFAGPLVGLLFMVALILLGFALLHMLGGGR